MASWVAGLGSSKSSHETTGPDPKEILRLWKPLKEVLGVTSVRTEREYARARATMDALLSMTAIDVTQMCYIASVPRC